MADGHEKLGGHRSRRHYVWMRIDGWEPKKMSSEDNGSNGRPDDEEDEDEEQEEETEDESEEHVFSEEITEREEDSEHGKAKRLNERRSHG